ncbi:MAG TPA: DUF4272 domain-containing protein [Thermoanaerobaculia bacterium]|nr:DUF4272 domain-containing protein [Thermoanaerobaculia bacterium]
MRCLANILPLFLVACTQGGEKRPLQTTPPTAVQVTQRAFVLAAIVARGAAERSVGDPEAEAFRVEVLQWLDAAGVTSALEPQELEILQAPLGTLTEQQAKNAGWRAEGLGVLAWALNQWELASFDVPTDAAVVAETLGFLKPEGLELLNSAQLRSPLETKELARRMYLIHMKLRLADQGSRSPDIYEVAKRLRVDPDKLGLVEDDLVIDDTPLKAASEDLVRMTLSTVVERHRAANWLLGDHPVYSEVIYAFRGME